MQGIKKPLGCGGRINIVGAKPQNVTLRKWGLVNSASSAGLHDEPVVSRSRFSMMSLTGLSDIASGGRRYSDRRPEEEGQVWTGC